MNDKTPWRVVSTNFGESMGRNSMSRIIDADGDHVLTVGTGSAIHLARDEIIAQQIVSAVNSMEMPNIETDF